MKAMILAAGFGTRLRPVTNVFAKPAVPFLNVPLLYYSMALLESAGVDQFVINSHYLPEQIETLAKAATRLMTAPIVKHETGAPLGSGGGIWNARHELKSSSFWIANGDEVILPRQPDIFQRIQSQHEKSNALATIVVMEHPGVGSQFGGIWANSSGDVIGFGKSGTDFPKTRGYHYIGLQLLSPRIFEYLPDGESNILYDALKDAIAAGEKIKVVISDFTWFETGNAHDFLSASKECLELLRFPEKATGSDRAFLLEALAGYSEQVKSGIVDWGFDRASAVPQESKNFDSAYSENAIVLAETSAKIAPSAIFQGAVSVGAHSIIGENAKIVNSVILAGARVLANAVVENEIVLPETK